jgi:hypothetical protein
LPIDDRIGWQSVRQRHDEREAAGAQPQFEGPDVQQHDIARDRRPDHRHVRDRWHGSAPDLHRDLDSS